MINEQEKAWESWWAYNFSKLPDVPPLSIPFKGGWEAAVNVLKSKACEIGYNQMEDEFLFHWFTQLLDDDPDNLQS